MYIFHMHAPFVILHSFLHFCFMDEIIFCLKNFLWYLFLCTFPCNKFSSVFMFVWNVFILPSLLSDILVKISRLLVAFFRHLEAFPLSSGVCRVSKLHCRSYCRSFEGSMLSPLVTARVTFCLLVFNSFAMISTGMVFFIFIQPGTSQSCLIPGTIYFVFRISFCLFVCF